MDKRLLAILLCLLAGLGLSGRAAAQRPTYSVAEATPINVDPPGVSCAATPGSCFKVHYVTSSAAAPAAADTSPANGVPDYVDQVASVLAEVFTREVTDRGWQAPPSDAASATSGGDGRHDVYVTDVSCGGIAYVQAEAAIAAGSKSWYAYMVLGKNLKACYDSAAINGGPGDLSTLTQLQVIEDVIAHEYHHVIQNGINRNASATLKEATANWMNDEVYDEINANVNSEALGDFTLFKTPATSVYSISYGGWFWLRYLSERFGADAVRAVWQELGSATSDSATATATALAARGSSLRDSWDDFAGKLLAREWFSEGATYPDLAAFGIANAGSPHATYPLGVQTAAVDHLARRYVRFVPATPAAAEHLLRVTFNGPDGQDSGGVLVVETADGRRIDHQIGLDASNDGAHVISGFHLAPPPAGDDVRVTSAVLAMANATATADGLSFSYCAPDCGQVGGADPTITPWGIDNGYRHPLWQTPDVWVDDDGDCLPDAPGRPGCNEPDDPATSPAVEAEPAKGKTNTLFARVRNLGNVAVTGAVVRFRYSPFGLGLPGPVFATIGTAPLALAAAGDAGGGDVQAVSVSWDLTDLTFNNGGAWDVPGTPAAETVADFDHFCVRIEIELAGDANPGNNQAQNNFGAVPSSSGRTGRTAFLIANAEATPEMARLELSPPLPPGWKLELDGGIEEGAPFQLAAGELRLVRATLVAPAGEPPANDVVADVSLILRGQPVGGVSILAARGTANGGRWWRRQWSVHFGVAEPLGRLRRTASTGGSVGLDVVWPLAPRTALDSRLSYARFPAGGDDFDVADLQVGLRRALVGSPQAFWFLRGGAGLFYLVDPDSLEGGLSAGLGWSRRIGPHTNLEWLGEYHRVLTTQPDVAFATLRAGILVDF